MLRLAPWLLALAFLALLYNLLPLSWEPTPTEITWYGELGGAPVNLRVDRTADGERLVLTGADQASRVTATWIPVTGQGVIFERALQRDGEQWRSGTLFLGAAEQWQVLLAAEQGSGVGALAASDWVRGADGVLRPVGHEPEGGALAVSWANRYGPAILTLAAAVIVVGGVWQVARRARRAVG